MMSIKSKGQEVGLAVVKRLVEALNGTITLKVKLVRDEIHNRTANKKAINKQLIQFIDQ